MADNNNKHQIYMSMLLYIAVAIFFVYLLLSNTLLPGLLRQQVQTVSYSEFLTRLTTNLKSPKVDLNTGQQKILGLQQVPETLEEVFETCSSLMISTLVCDARDHSATFGFYS